MTFSDLKREIEKKNNLTISLRKQLNNTQQELNNLREQFYQMEMQEFVDYLQIGEVIEFNNYHSFKAYSSDPKATTSFSMGDRIKIFKKNKKSIVVECVKKITRRWDDTQKKSVAVGEIVPEWKLRIDLDSFFHFYLKSPTMRAAFDSYVKRKHALDNLFDE
jgi:hypothetical protein